MKRIQSLLLLPILALALGGCLQVEKLIKLNVDGSGTIEETVVMSKEVVEQMKSMTEGMSGAFGKSDGAPTPKPKPFSLLDEEKLKADAVKMGEGVRYVSSKKISTDTQEGFSAVYAFDDITKIKVDQNPGSAAPKMGPEKASDDKKTEPLTFQFTKGNPASLTVNMPEPKMPKGAEGADAEKAREQTASMMPMMKQMFKDMKIAIGIEFAGKITETNATYREGSRVTLMEMDFNKLLADPAKFEEFSKKNPKTLEETKALLKDIPGIKAETTKQVTVKFQ